MLWRWLHLCSERPEEQQKLLEVPKSHLLLTLNIALAFHVVALKPSGLPSNGKERVCVMRDEPITDHCESKAPDSGRVTVHLWMIAPPTSNILEAKRGVDKWINLYTVIALTDHVVSL